MSITEMALRVAVWTSPSGIRYRFDSEYEAVLSDGDGESRWYVRDRDGHITVWSAQRGAEFLDMETDQLIDAERYLTFTLGRSMRLIAFPQSNVLRVPWTLGGVAEGFEIVRAAEGELQAVVLESGVERARFRHYDTPYHAVPFTIYANVSIEDLRSSLLDPVGAPALTSYVDH